ncbi:MAG: hypothetical protein ACLP59_12010 [Bryobacteraceae bacterium]
MLRSSRLAMILGLAAAMAGPSITLAQKDQDRDQDAKGIAEAIRFQKAEDAAAARQARIEAARARGENSADRMAPAANAKPHHVKTSTARKTPPPPQH